MRVFISLLGIAMVLWGVGTIALNTLASETKPNLGKLAVILAGVFLVVVMNKGKKRERE